MWFVTGFMALGFLAGNLIGMTAQSVVTSVLGMLFTFVGGSLIAFLEKLTPENRITAGKALTALCCFCLVGIYTGIFLSEHQLLSPKLNGKAQSQGIEGRTNFYLRSSLVDAANMIDMKYAAGNISAAEAYRQLRDQIEKAKTSATESRP